MDRLSHRVATRCRHPTSDRPRVLLDVRAGCHVAPSRRVHSNPAVARVTLIEIEGVSAYVDERYGAELDKTTALIERLVFADLAVGKNAILHPRMLARALLGSLYQLAKDWTRSRFVEPIDVLVFHTRAMAMGALQQLRTSV